LPFQAAPKQNRSEAPLGFDVYSLISTQKHIS